MRLTDLQTEYFNIGKTPCVFYGDKNSKKAVLYVHGLCGNKEEAERFASLAVLQGFCVIAFDLAEHVGRTDGTKLVPWETVPEIKNVYDCAAKNRKVYLRTESVGTYFSLLALAGEKIEKCLFVSPLTDMVGIINGMLAAAKANLNRLEKEKNIVFGNQIISWDYYVYAKNHKVGGLAKDTLIVYSSPDYVVGEQSIQKFAYDSNATAVEMAGGEHYFHTPKQVAFLEKYERLWLGGEVNAESNVGLKIGGVSAQEYGEAKILFLNLEKIHTTEGGVARIKRNLKLGDGVDAVEYCKRLICDRNAKGRFAGKNLYISLGGEEITLNRSSYTIITAKGER